jgi:hypothetical protein
MLMANAMTDPMKVPNWNIAGFGIVSVDGLSAGENNIPQNIPNIFPLSFSSG